MDVSLSTLMGQCIEMGLPRRYRDEVHLPKLVHRIASRLANRYPYKKDTFAGSLCFYIECFLTQYLPLRALAAKAKQDGQVLDIRLGDTQFAAFTGWIFGEMPMLILACEAQRIGVPFKFHGAAELADKPVLTIRLHPGAIPKPIANGEYSDFPHRTLVSLMAFRDFPAFNSDDKEFGFFYSHHAYRQDSKTDIGFNVSPAPYLEKTISVGLGRGPDRDVLNHIPTVYALLDTLFVPMFERYLAEAHKLVGEADIRKLHVTDHPFLENSLLKDAVLARGGEVSLFSHGFNPAGLNIAANEGITSITVPCRKSGEIWAERTDAHIRVRSDVARFRSHRRVGRYQPGKMGSIHIFGCEEFRGYIPQNPKGSSNVGLYLNLLQGASDPQIVFKFRERVRGVSLAMLKNHPFGASLQPGEESPAHASDPNMVFIFVGPATSGLYEAVGRGIPVLRVKMPDAPEYLHVDEVAIKVFNPAEAIVLAKYLAKGQGYDEVAQYQFQWFADQIRDRDLNTPEFDEKIALSA